MTSRIEPSPPSSARSPSPKPAARGEPARAFRALLAARGALPSPAPRASSAPGRARCTEREPTETPREPFGHALARLERPTDPGPIFDNGRRAPPTPSLSAQSVECFQVIPAARALRLKLSGKAGKASVEVELEERDGELSLSIDTEDGDRGRALEWARAIDEALSRRGLRGQIVPR